jgi:hypothetical protein
MCVGYMGNTKPFYVGTWVCLGFGLLGVVEFMPSGYQRNGCMLQFQNCLNVF